MEGITVIAATDFSEDGDQAVERAAAVAASLGGARLEVVNVISVRSLKSLRKILSTEAEPVETLLVSEATSALSRLTESLSTRYGIPVESYLARGTPAHEIVIRADELDSALVVVGSRGTNPARDLLLGTTARNVIRKTRRNVLVVKQPAQTSYRNVVVATDFSDDSLQALNAARALAPKAALTALHAFEVPFEGKLQYAGVSRETIERCRSQSQREAEHAARVFAQRANLNSPCVVAHGTPTLVIREHAERMKVDLIAVGKHGQSMIEELLIGSVSEYVLAYAGCDVLVGGWQSRFGTQ